LRESKRETTVLRTKALKLEIKHKRTDVKVQGLIIYSPLLIKMRMTGAFSTIILHLLIAVYLSSLMPLVIPITHNIFITVYITCFACLGVTLVLYIVLFKTIKISEYWQLAQIAHIHLSINSHNPLFI
jgi:hypothetical protein